MWTGPVTMVAFCIESGSLVWALTLLDPSAREQAERYLPTVARDAGCLIDVVEVSPLEFLAMFSRPE